MDFCKCVELYWYSRRNGSLLRPFLSNVVNVFALVESANEVISLFLRGSHHWRFEAVIVLSVIELHLGLVYFSALFMITVVVSLSALLRATAGLFF